MNDYNSYDLGYLCKPKAFFRMFMKESYYQVYWRFLAKNPNAIRLLEQFPENINYSSLSSNPNPSAMYLLKRNIDEADEYQLSENPSIFEYDYEAMRNRMKPIAEEIMANRFHPRNFDKFVSWGFEDFEL